MDSSKIRVCIVQSIVGLVFLSHGNPSIMFSFPQVMTWRVTFWASPWISTDKSQVYQMSPLLLLKWSAFLARMGMGSSMVGRLCFLTKCWSIQEMSALLSTNAQVSMTLMECEEMIS